MLRKKLIDKKLMPEDSFHWRSSDVTRLEGFSDAVFAFAMTLLVVSLEVPRTFSELMVTAQPFTPSVSIYRSG